MIESTRAAYGACAIDRCEISKDHGPGVASDLLRADLSGPDLGLDVLEDSAPRTEAVACGCTPDDLTAGCSDFTAVSKLPLVHCPVRGSRYDTGCASGRKRQPS